MKLRVTRKQIALCLVAGVVTTGAVAWLGTIFAPTDTMWPMVGASLGDEIRSLESWAWQLRSLQLRRERADTPESNDPAWAWDHIRDVECKVAYDAVTMQHRPEQVLWKQWVFVTAGWPCTAFRGWDFHVFDPDRKLGNRSPNSRFCLVDVPAPRGNRGYDESIELPLFLVWPGFIANTLIYGALWWILFAGLISARAARRARRGLCVRCAYDLRGVSSDVCPECGQARPT